MTLSTTTNRVRTSGDGGTVAFSFPYYVESASDLDVYITTAAGVETLQVISTDYTVSGPPSASNTITFLSAPSATETVTIMRSEPLVQEVDVDGIGTFKSQGLENNFDRLVRMAQRLKGLIDRAPKVQASSANTGLVFPEPEASAFIAWNSGATALENSDVSVTDITNAVTYASNASDSADAAASSASAASSSASSASSSASAASTAQTNAETAETNAETAETNAETAQAAAEAAATQAANAIGLKYAFSTTTTASDPGSGILRFNNATLASVTAIYIDDLDAGGEDVSAFINVWDAASTTNKSILIIRQLDDVSKWAAFHVTNAVDSTGYWTITVSYITGGSLPDNAGDISLVVSLSGDDGAGAVNSVNGETGTVTIDAGDIGIVDAGGNFAATEVESALAEIYTDFTLTATLASTSNGDGASLIGVEDSGANFTATDVEGVLAELATDVAAAGGDGWVVTRDAGSAFLSGTNDATLGNDNGCPVIQFADGSTTRAYFSFNLPHAYDGSSDITVAITFRSTVSANNIVMEYGFGEHVGGTLPVLDDLGTTWAGGSNTITYTQTFNAERGAGAGDFGIVSGGELMVLMLQRVGGDAGDTNTGTLYVYGIEIYETP